MSEVGDKRGCTGLGMREKEERSEEEGALLHFIAQSLTSCADRY